MRRHVIAVLTAAATLAACNRTDTLGDNAPPRTPEPAAPAAALPAGEGETQALPSPTTAAGLVARIGQNDLFEVEAGRLALQRSRTPAVRAFAQSMVDAHARSSQSLAAALQAARIDLRLPQDLDRARSDLSAELRSVEPDAFDDTYLTQQVQAHEETLQLLRTYAEGGDSTALRTWAERQAGVVQEHLEAVRALAPRQEGAPTAAAPGASAGGQPTAGGASPAATQPSAVAPQPSGVAAPASTPPGQTPVAPAPAAARATPPR